MPEEAADNVWRLRRLGDICRINPDKRGADWPAREIEYIDISSVGTGVLTAQPARLPVDEAPSRAQRLVQPGDTILATVRPNLRSFMYLRETKSNTVVSTGFAVLRARARTDSRFIYYVVSDQAFTEYLTARAHGSAYPAVSVAVIEEAEVLVPPPDARRSIGDVLGSLDDKIEQNRRTARALERLARAIFKAWFVDFEPVKAKAAGAASFPSMPQEVFDALPITFTDSEIGPVPEDWEVKSIATIATFLNGLALQKYPPRGDGHDLRVIKIAQLRKGSTEGADWANGDVPNQFIVNDRDLLFSWSGTLEAELWFGGKGALNQHLFKVTSAHFPQWYCLLWIRQHLPWFRAIAASKATTMGHIQRGHLQEAKVVIPPAHVIGAANEVIGTLYELQSQVQIESRKLAQMRDLLLPNLLSGVVRVDPAGGRDGD